MEDSLRHRHAFRANDRCISSVVVGESNPASFSDRNHPEKVSHVGLTDIINTTVVFKMFVSPSLKIGEKRVVVKQYAFSLVVGESNPESFTD